jgi:hypothetical protein
MSAIISIVSAQTSRFVGFVAAAPSRPFTSTDAISLFIALLAVIAVCLSFAWDGLVRRRVLFAGFVPLGIRPRVLGPVSSVIVGLITALLAAVGGLYNWFVAVLFTRLCDGSWACMGSSLLHLDLYAWVTVIIFGGYVLLAQLGALQGPKCELCVGVTYDPRRVQRAVRQDMRKRGLARLSRERVAALEQEVAEYMRGKHWLPPLHGTSHTPPRTWATQEAMLDTLRQDALYVKANLGERATMETLLIYFTNLEQASRTHA